MKIKTISKDFTTVDINLDYIKQSLNIDSSYYDEDKLLNSYKKIAIEYIENKLFTDLTETNYQLTYDDFAGNILKIYKANYSGIISISGTSEEGVTTEITAYEVKQFHNFFVVEFDDSIDCFLLTINFKTKASYLAEVIKQAIVIKVADLYDSERSSYTVTAVAKNDEIINSLINSYKKTIIF